MGTHSRLRACSVVGLGKLGSALATCLSSRGFTVIGVDLDTELVASLNAGRTRLAEPGLAELVVANRDRLRATSSYDDAIRDSSVTFIVVPTPSEHHGGFSLRHVVHAAQRIGTALAATSDYHLIVLTSTVVPGSTLSEVRPVLEAASGKVCGRDFGLCYSPLFVSLGTVIHDI